MGTTRLDHRPQDSVWLNTVETAERLNVTNRFVRRVLRFDPFMQGYVRQDAGNQPLYFHRDRVDLWAMKNCQAV
jgi:hypothetical protein